MNTNKIKGLPGVSFTELNSGRPFYTNIVKLAGVGNVTTDPDTKEGLTHYLQTHATARGASSAQNQSNGASR